MPNSSQQYPRHRSEQINFRLTPAGKELFERLRAFYGLTQSGLIEMLVRDRAREVGVIIPGSGEETALRQLREKLKEWGGHFGIITQEDAEKAPQKKPRKKAG